ncbi:MAG TPA: hypothetical protein VHX86_17175 [Tepidisphaeraceae bacterium]|jgi:hypothetical protein|nr:hypothetical protein [Tepidisphaeraceae bacterium]
MAERTANESGEEFNPEARRELMLKVLCSLESGPGARPPVNLLRLYESYNFAAGPGLKFAGVFPLVDFLKGMLIEKNIRIRRGDFDKDPSACWIVSKFCLEIQENRP